MIQLRIRAYEKIMSSPSAIEPYLAIVQTFPAEVTTEIDRDAGIINFRVAGTRVSVTAEVERISKLCAGRGWVRLIGPLRWGDDYVTHGVLMPFAHAT
jgi:hypothetical protein